MAASLRESIDRRRSRQSYSRHRDDESESGDQPDIARTKSFEIAARYQDQSAKVADVKRKQKGGKRVKKQEKEGLREELEMDEHQLDVATLCSRLGTNVDTGLSEGMAAELLRTNGPNALTPAKGVPLWKIFVEHMFYGFSGLLWVGALLCFIGFGLDQTSSDNLYLGLVLVFVVVFTGLFSFYQNHQSIKTMRGFAQMVPSFATVLRDGSKRELDAADLVLGDVVFVVAGDKVPGDVRFVEARGMKVDNSSLTGESEPQTRTADMTDENPMETKNIGFFSTSVLEGSGKGIVIRCGDHTMIGRIAGLATQTTAEDTPIAIEIEHFIIIICSVAIALGALFFIFGLFVYPAIEALVFVIGIIVANVPEGLLATVTVALTLTSKRMASKNVLVKNLESVETLGSTSVICSDKTGTLTQNRMTCAHIVPDLTIATTKTSTQSASYEPTAVATLALAANCAVCNTASFEPGQDDVDLQERKTSGGNASEAALLKFAEFFVTHDLKNAGGVESFRENFPKYFELPFNSTDKYMVTIAKPADPDEPRFLLFMKGAPERILARCSTILLDGDVKPLDTARREKVETLNEELGGFGERVLGFAQLYLDPEEFPTETTRDEWATDTFGEKIKALLEVQGGSLSFVGLASLIDPPREQVPPAVATCQTAGIKVVMVTGDHPVTASAIARQVGIFGPKAKTAADIAGERGCSVTEVKFEDPAVTAIAVKGDELKEMSEEDLDKVITKPNVVFARTSPQQKLRIVAAFQRAGNYVAVTGDGVNDSPALKKADIGIAMGITGSDVSKEAADMILLDDNFASIVRGVEEGRLIFDNLKKSIAYTLSSNIPELIPFLSFMVFRVPLPLPTIMILCVDLGTDLIPAISLAYEEAESDIMLRHPRNPLKDRLVTARLISFSYLQIGVMQALAGMYTYLVVLGDKGFDPTKLLFTEPDFSNEDVDMVFDGKLYDFDTRTEKLAHAQTAYFVSIVVVQWADLLICKTRMLSVFQQGLRNNILNFGLFSETALAAIVCYVPFCNTIFGTAPIAFVHWLPAIPFSLLIFSYDECRKAWIRRYPDGWLYSHTYY